MKTYIDAKLRIVRMDNNDIVTTSVKIGESYTEGQHTADAPGRRSIWD